MIEHEEGAGAPTSAATSMCMEPQRRGRSVLILEPDPNRQSRLARMFTVEGHRVVGTSSADGALALLSQFPVDMLLLADECESADIERVSSFAVERRPGVRVVLLGNQEPALRKAGHPGLEYLRRPARMEQVARVVA